MSKLKKMKYGSFTQKEDGLSNLGKQGAAIATDAFVPGLGQVLTGYDSVIKQVVTDSNGLRKKDFGNVLINNSNPLSAIGDSITAIQTQNFADGPHGRLLASLGIDVGETTEEKRYKESLKEQEGLRFSNMKNAYKQMSFNDSQNLKGNKVMKNGGRVTGGKILPVGKNAAIVEGNSHENGGVKINDAGVEVEKNEVIYNTGDGEFVFSDHLGFADKAKRLVKVKARLDKSLANNSNDPILKASVAKVENDILKLANEQEEFKNSYPEALIVNGKQMKYGGYRLYKKGGLLPGLDNLWEDYNQPISNKMTGAPGKKSFFTKLRQSYNENIGGLDFDFNTKPITDRLSKVSDWDVQGYANMVPTILATSQEIPDVPEQNQLSRVSLSRVNYNDALNNADVQTATARKSIQGTNAQVANAVSAKLTADNINAKNNIYGEQNRRNIEILNNETMANMQIQEKNNNIDYLNRMNKFDRAKYMINRRQEAIESLTQQQNSNFLFRKYMENQRDIEKSKLNIKNQTDKKLNPQQGLNFFLKSNFGVGINE